jgi:poly-gamma-glutamate synthesis protein (capsule biosynthesis protein)
MIHDNMNSIIIKAVGDICPGDKSILGLGVLNMTKRYGADFPFEEVSKFLKTGNLVIANFEGLLSKKVMGDHHNFTFCGLPDFAGAMVRSGFNVINIANNHVLEHGVEMFQETVEILQKAGIKICGLRNKTSDYYSEPVIIPINGRNIGIIGYNWVGVDKFKEADRYIAQSHDSLVNYTWLRENKNTAEPAAANKLVISDIKTLRSKVDHLILVTHWGYEFINVPPYNVLREAHAFIDAGADLIIGGHPHVLQGMEKYKDGMIFYSLGNFIFDLRRRVAKKTAILDIHIQGNSQISFQFRPCVINREFQPEEANPHDTQLINSLISQSNDLLLSPQCDILLNDDLIYKKYEKKYNSGRILIVLDHFLAMGKNPRLFILILHKGMNFLKILWDRLKGKKVRW